MAALWACANCGFGGSCFKGRQELVGMRGKYNNITTELALGSLLTGVRQEPLHQMAQLCDVYIPSHNSMDAYVDKVS